MRPWFILGAGALGSALAVLMQRRGIRSVLLARDDRGEREVCLEQTRARVPTQRLREFTPGTISRALIATKAGEIESAVAELIPYLTPQAVAITTANGLGFARSYSRVEGPLVLERAVTTAGAFRDRDGRIQLVAEGTTRIGCRGDVAVAPWFEDSLVRMPGWRWDPAIDLAVAHKFAVNCVINPLTALLRCRNGELLKADRAGSDLAMLCDETEPALRTLKLWSGPTSLTQAAEDVCRSTAQNRSSMLQDVLAQRQTELAYLTGELLQRGEAAGLDLPRNRALFEALGGGPGQGDHHSGRFPVGGQSKKPF